MAFLRKKEPQKSKIVCGSDTERAAPIENHQSKTAKPQNRPPICRKAAAEKQKPATIGRLIFCVPSDIINTAHRGGDVLTHNIREM